MLFVHSFCHIQITCVTISFSPGRISHRSYNPTQHPTLTFNLFAFVKFRMKSNFQFSNLIGTVYRQGNVTFTPDGNSVLSPVGNRVSVFDLVNNKSRTLNFETRKNIACVALSPDGNVVMAIDLDGRAIFASFRKGTALHHMNFKAPVNDVSFSPDGKFFAITHQTHLQIWKTPSHLAREFAPFALHRTYTGHRDEVLTVTWSPCSRYILTTSRDMTARLFTLHPVEGFRPKTFSGHRDIVVKAYFSKDSKTIYTVSRDGAVFVWQGKTTGGDEASEDEDFEPETTILDAPGSSTSEAKLNEVAYTRWGVTGRHYFAQPGTKVVCTTFHPGSSMLVVGFSTGVFGLWELPSFTNVHTLSISQEKISSVAINQSGEWLVFGASKLGQLLVWEWQSESYVLKQQGHYFDMNALSFSQDGQNIATGGDDGKVKVWNMNSGFCYVTFSEHSSSISSVEFAKQGQVLFTASLDGTVRAFDLVRYRNFRTFTSPTPVQFSSLAVDPSGEVVAAGSLDSFEIFLWSVQTGKLLDILTGHTAPVSALSFDPTGNHLASVSWDRTCRLWTIFGRSKKSEVFSLSSDALAVAFRPDGKELAASTLDGQISFWDTLEGKQTGVIEGRKDIAGGRKQDDRVTAANNSTGKSFNSLAYTADGSCVLAGGNSKYVVLYDVRDGVMVKKFQISENLSLDGTQEKLDSRKMTEGGVSVDTLDERGNESDLEDRLDLTLPGAQRGDLSKRKYKQEVRTKAVRFSPTGRSWAAASTEGLLIYSLDETVTFDPFDLAIDITPQSLLATLESKDYLLALIVAFRLNERHLIVKTYESIPPTDIRLIAGQLPKVYVKALLRFIAGHIEEGPHVEFDLIWVSAVLTAHGRWLRDRSGEFASEFRAIQKGVTDFSQSIARLSDENSFSLSYIIHQQQAFEAQLAQGEDDNSDLMSL